MAERARGLGGLGAKGRSKWSGGGGERRRGARGEGARADDTVDRGVLHGLAQALILLVRPLIPGQQAILRAPVLRALGAGRGWGRRRG